MARYELTDPSGKRFVVNAPDNATEEQVLNYFKSQTKQIDPNLGAAREALQGLTFDFADELGLGAAAVAASIQTGKPVAEVYRDMQEQFQSEQQQFQQERPGLAMGSRLAGGVLGGLATGGTTLGTQIAQAPIRAGAAMGALQGAGQARTLADIPSEMLSGAGFGAIGGGVTRGLVGRAATPTKPEAQGLIRWGFNKAGSGLRGVGRMAGLKEKPAQPALRALQTDLRRSGMTPDEISQQMKTLGPEGILADIPEFRGTAQGVVTQPGAGRNIATRALDTRAAETSKRVMNEASRLTKKDGRVLGELKTILSKRSKEAGPLYKQADAESVPIEGINSLKASILSQAEKAKGTRIGASLKRVANMIGDKTNIEQLHFVKTEIADMEGAAFRAGKGNLGGKLKDARKGLTEIMDKASPAYKQANKIFGDQTEISKALELGTKVLRQDADVAADTLQGMSKAQKDAFISGAMKAVRDKVLSGEKFTKELLRERLRNAFPDDTTFNQFTKRLDAERVFAETRQDVLKGSQTAMRQAAQSDLAEKVTSTFMNFMTGGKVGAAASLVRGKLASMKNIPEPVREELGKILFTPEGGKKAIDLLKQKNFNSKEIQRIMTSLMNISVRTSQQMASEVQNGN